MASAAFWGFIPGVLKAVSGAHEVVTTIMLNYVALAVVAAAVSGPLTVQGSRVADHAATSATPRCRSSSAGTATSGSSTRR